MTRLTARKRPKSAPGVGKRVGAFLYVHKDALSLIGETADCVRTAEQRAPSDEWNVVKIGSTSVSLLLYEPFDVDFPTLLASTRVDFQTDAGKHRTDYRKRINPPILHRKELLLPPDDPRLPKFRALTAAAEEHGLFREPNKIGMRTTWNSMLEEAGLVLRNGSLIRADDEHVDVARHRTAIVRRDLSQPMQLMMRFGIVTQERSLFDYGCGQGEDVAALSSQGFEAFGWDPHHASGGNRRNADVVNLGFVLNVIEDPRERIETLKSAWNFAQQALCVAVMVQGKTSTAGYRSYRDGFLTSRGTFQKYFEQQELRDFVMNATGQAPLALASGIVVVFRDKELEQEVLLRRRSRSLYAGELPRPPARERELSIRLSLRERLTPILDILHAIAVPLGRLPEPEETPRDIIAALADERVSWDRTVALLRGDLDADEAFAISRDARRSDILVHLALMQFPGAPKYKALPRAIQADIKAFFRSLAAAQEEARRLLFAAGDRTGIRSDINAAISDGLGGNQANRWFRFRASTLPLLPSRLRVLVGCAEVLQGGVDACDFVDIDIETPRITMLTCDDIERPIPFIVERVTVDLARLKVSAKKLSPQMVPLYFKSRFLVPNDGMRAVQTATEDALAATGLFTPGRPDPSWEDVTTALTGLPIEFRVQLR